MRKGIRIKYKLIGLMGIWLISLSLPAYAQLNPFQAMYFQNRYQYNPAMAGIESGLTLNFGYRQQLNGLPGAPKTSLFTAGYQTSQNVGLGLNVTDEQEGLIRQTRAVGTYAYHLPLNSKGDKLSFGLSLGVNDARIDYNKVSGDINDAQIAAFNQLKAYVDGDFGIAYNNDQLYIGAALPNLKSAFFKSSDQRFDADRLLFIASAAYKAPLDEINGNYTLEPLVAVRVIKGYNTVYDAGINFMINKYGLYTQAVYHSSNNIGLGAGLDQKNYAVTFSYGVETGRIGTAARGTFEFGLKVKLFGE